MTRYVHRLYGECTIQCRYNTHWVINTNQGIKSCAPDFDLTEIQDTPAQVIPLVPPAEQPAPPPSLDPSDKVDVNHLPFVALAKKIPQLGRMSSKRIKERQPKLGYDSFEQLRQLNKDLFDEESAWDALETQMRFEAIAHESSTP